MIEPTRRFSNRADAYLASRPGYPTDLLATLEKESDFARNWIVADIGSGTGLLSELFLQHGNRVLGIEPNAEMRAAGARRLADYARFESLGATAEALPLAPATADLITAGQAFHWFDPGRARGQFQRVLRPLAWVMLVWNTPEWESTPFMQAYERLLIEYGVDYQRVDHRRVAASDIARFYREGGYLTHTYENPQVFDYQKLENRLRSTSYLPAPDQTRFGAMISRLQEIFARYAEAGTVSFLNTTRMYLGRLG